FSSRRRHTRFSRDWSSDVCSSDLGCAFTPRLIVRVGHIRTFAALVSVASAAALGYPVAIEAMVWVVLRLITGFCLAGLYLVVEKIGRASCREKLSRTWPAEPVERI